MSDDNGWGDGWGGPAPAQPAEPAAETPAPRPEPSEAGEDAGAGHTGSRKHRPARPAPGVRRVIDVYERVRTLPDDVRGIAAAIFSAGGDDWATLTEKILAADRDRTAAIADTLTLADADEMGRLVAAIEMGEDRLRGVWRVIGALSGSPSRLKAANIGKAALAVHRGVGGLDQHARDRLSALAALIED